ncbi:MAG TPA: DUF4189 domain-containing protein [Nocardioides sp.]|nr:DUF4189 domain-containing protein [Nocardioides sp.]
MTRPTILRAVVAIAAALLLATTAFSAAPANARNHDAARAAAFTPRTQVSERVQCHVPNCWVAAAVNIKTGIAYVRWNRPTRSGARQVIESCRHDKPKYSDGCRHAGDQRNGCVAVAYRTSNGEFKEWAFGTAGFRRGVSTRRTQARAVAIAKGKLAHVGKKHVWTKHCTGR